MLVACGSLAVSFSQRGKASGCHAGGSEKVRVVMVKSLLRAST